MKTTGKLMKTVLKNMNIAKHMNLAQAVIDARTNLEVAEAKLDEVNKVLRAGVTVVKVGKTFTMTKGDVAIKCVQNRHFRFDVKRNNKMIVRDTHLSINELRLAVALGNV